MSAITSLLFLGSVSTLVSLSSLVLALKTTAVAFVIVWFRATLPRLRYDALMVFCWTQLLPMVIGLLLLSTLRHHCLRCNRRLVLSPLGPPAEALAVFTWTGTRAACLCPCLGGHVGLCSGGKHRAEV
jgi:hypothetical protein